MTNLQKVSLIGLVLVVFVWVGIGGYYFKSAKPSVVKEVFEDLSETHLIIGEFQNWEEIKDSEDRYILLINPETERNYPKIKVIWDPSNPYEGDESWEGVTAFSVEKSEGEYGDPGYLQDFTSEEVDKFFKKGDSITVIFEEETTNNYLALSLFVKRAK